MKNEPEQPGTRTDQREASDPAISTTPTPPLVVMDTNALFQAMRNNLAYYRGKYGTSREYDWGIEKSDPEYAPSRLFSLVESGSVKLATSSHIRGEVERVLDRHRGNSADPHREACFSALRQILSEAMQIEPSVRISICRDPDDDRIIECALTAHADYIITEDRDLLSLGSYKGIRIVTMLEFMEMPERGFARTRRAQ